MRKLILLSTLTIAMLYAGAYLGTDRLNKSASIAASKSIHGEKVAWAYVLTEWDSENE